MANEALRVAMAAKGETVESLAEKVRVDPKTAGRWLTSGRIPHPRTRLAVAEVLDRDAAELWPEPFRRRDLPWFRPWAELEQDATSIRSYEPLLVPGLLQSEGYARAVLGTGGLLSAAEVDQIVAGRLERQEILCREEPPQLVVVIDEVVLRRPVAGRAVMAEQLAHLAAMAQREHVQIRVIPAEGPWHTGLAGPFVLARLRDGVEVAYLDNQLRGQMVTDGIDVASLGRRWESVTGEALPCRRSIALIREVAQTWT
ncbi:Scr1 family TA system antitoxin-like transcriptional regulator [Micromonospora sp. NPDC049460]|uniref:Scr1 family TA system antitoxin-like transcriptional regulator n=1 Tax=Micromonospora sp. NPDC049460 TaxID=3364272 RepID=UPI0037911D54